MKTFDLLVLGSGPSGGRVAMSAAKSGMNVAMIESRSYGGNCALRGCNPKKVLVHAAEVVDAARRSDNKLCDAADIKINWPQLMAFKETFVESIPADSRAKFDDAGIKTFLGSPAFKDANSVVVNGEVVSADKILIATGSRPSPLNIAGEDLITDSDDFLDLKTLPKRIAFIGAGYITMEFAHVAARADAEVTILQRGDRPLKSFEPFIVDELVKKSASLGMKIVCNLQVTKLEKSSNGQIKVSYQKDGQLHELKVDMVVHGAGRVPNLDGLRLDVADVAFDSRKGVAVDAQMRSTSNPSIFASGDCADTQQPRLTPVANQQGFAIANLIKGDAAAEPDYGPIPKVVFTVPPLASVGLTEAAARESGRKIKVNQKDDSDAGNIRKVCETHAAHTVVIDEETKQILGAHLFGPSASETINIFAVAMKAGMTARELKSVLIAFPTFASDIRMMV